MGTFGLPAQAELAKSSTVVWEASQKEDENESSISLNFDYIGPQNIMIDSKRFLFGSPRCNNIFKEKEKITPLATRLVNFLEPMTEKSSR